MSDQELLKWKNKYRLYKVLHHDLEWENCCSKCKLYKIDCSYRITLSYVKDTNKMYYQAIVPKGGICIEWVRHV
jgi:hypothetical protein